MQSSVTERVVLLALVASCGQLELKSFSTRMRQRLVYSRRPTHSAHQQKSSLLFPAEITCGTEGDHCKHWSQIKQNSSTVIDRRTPFLKHNRNKTKHSTLPAQRTDFTVVNRACDKQLTITADQLTRQPFPSCGPKTKSARYGRPY